MLTFDQMLFDLRDTACALALTACRVLGDPALYASIRAEFDAAQK